MMSSRDGEPEPKCVRPHPVWLDEDTEAEIMPPRIVLTVAGDALPRDTTVTFVENESTDDV